MHKEYNIEEKMTIAQKTGSDPVIEPDPVRSDVCTYPLMTPYIRLFPSIGTEQNPSGGGGGGGGISGYLSATV